MKDQDPTYLTQGWKVANMKLFANKKTLFKFEKDFETCVSA